MNEQQIVELREAFTLFDTNDDGMLDSKDLFSTYKKLGIIISESDIKEIIKAVDKENKGKISFQDFLDVTMSASVYKDEELQEIFKIFDKESKGFITKADLKQLFRDLGEKPNEVDIVELLKLADLSAEANITFADFKKLMSK